MFSNCDLQTLFARHRTQDFDTALETFIYLGNSVEIPLIWEKNKKCWVKLLSLTIYSRKYLFYKFLKFRRDRTKTCETKTDILFLSISQHPIDEIDWVFFILKLWTKK